MRTQAWAALALVAALCLVVAVPVAAKSPERPFGGVVTGQAAPVMTPSDCPSGAVGRYAAAGTGQMLHLGRMAYTVTHCAFMSSPVDGYIGPGTIKLTAANGDTLVLTEISGTFKFDQPMPKTTTSHAAISWKVASGTGRFEGAAGSGTAAGDASMVTGVEVMRFTGTISY